MSGTIEPPADSDAATAMLARAQAATDAGEVETARALYDALIGAGMLQQWAWFFLGRIHRAHGELAAADRAYDQALAADPSLFWAHFEALTLAAEMADAGRIVARAETMLAIVWETLSPGHVPPLEEAAQLLWDDGHEATAVAFLQRLVPIGGLGRLALARLVAGTHDAAVAEAARAALTELPDAPLTPGITRGLPDPARDDGASPRLAMLRRRRHLAPDDFSTWLALADFYDADEAGALLDRAHAARDAGDPDTAIGLYHALIATKKLREWAWMYLGRLYRDRGDVARAAHAYDQAASGGSPLFWAHYEGLTLAIETGASPERIDAMAAAMLAADWETLDPNRVPPLEDVAHRLWEEGHEAVATALLERLLPSGGLGRLALIRLIEGTGDAAVADAARTALAELPEPPVGPEIVRALPDPARDDRAESRLATLRRRRRLAPDDFATWLALADYYDADEAGALLDRAHAARDAGDPETAIGLYHALIATKKLREWAWMYLGRLYRDRGDVARAADAYDQAASGGSPLFWAHYEGLTLAIETGASPDRIDAMVAAMLAADWETLDPSHVAELEEIAHRLWDARHEAVAAALFARLYAAAPLGRLALERLAVGAGDQALAEAARAALATTPTIDPQRLAALGDPGLRGDPGQRSPVLERRRRLAPADAATWLALVDLYAAIGERGLAATALAEGAAFGARERSLAALAVAVASDDDRGAFRAFRDHARVHGETPKHLGIVLAYRLSDAFERQGRDEIVALLALHHPDDRDVALLGVHVAMRDQRWTDAQVLFDARLAGLADPPANVRIARIDLLAFRGQVAEAAAALAIERAADPRQAGLLRSSLRILAELGRWDEALDIGLVDIGADDSFEHFLAALVRAARKTGRAGELLEALLALPRPLSTTQVDALCAVMEDLAEAGDRAILERADGIAIPAARALRIRLKLRDAGTPDAAARDLCIYYCADRAYLLPAFVSLASLATSNMSVARRAVFRMVVDADLLPVVRRFGEALAHRLGIVIEPVDAAPVLSSVDRLRTGYGMFTGGQQLSLAAYYRIFFARHLAEEARFAQALYVDADTIVRGGLGELFDMPFAAPLMARTETDRPEVRHATALHGLSGDYFNSGVLRLDLADPALPALLDRAIAAAIDPAVPLVFQDQCALNIAFDGAVSALPDRFNFFNPPSRSGDEIAGSDAVIVHFLDRPKPWDGLYRHPAREWFEWFDLVRTLAGGVEVSEAGAFG